MANAQNVANLFLSWANNDGDLITNLKMQKLLYYAQAWHYVNFQAPLFDDEIEAWKLGPVVRNVYKAFREFGSSAIDYKTTGKETAEFEEGQLEFLKDLYKAFIRFSASDLVDMSHNETPWKEASQSGNPISGATMTSFYTELYEKKTATAS